LRETLFNILTPRIGDARVIDAYAGTGALGIEALQPWSVARGVRRELVARGGSHQRQSRGLRRGGGYTIQRGDVLSVLRQRVAGAAFDLILLDPPYDIASTHDVLAAAASLVRPDGLVVLERATRREPAAPSSLVRTRDVVSGDSTLTFFAAVAGQRIHRSTDEPIWPAERASCDLPGSFESADQRSCGHHPAERAPVRACAGGRAREPEKQSAVRGGRAGGHRA
jgi:16S rRNA (guanine966-N2)-methyltransferase